jgi:hypothetical protein
MSTRKIGKRHGHRTEPTRTYISWKKMKTRCLNPKSEKYRLYGKAGVVVCDRWQYFDKFLADMGERPPGTTLGRILDRGNYEPGNCFWMTPSEQGLARQNNNALLRWELSRATVRKLPLTVRLDTDNVRVAG